MKRLALLCLALVVAPPVASAHPVRLGTITADSTTSQTNATTAVPFRNTRPNLLAGLSLYVQCDAAAWVQAVRTSTTSVTKGTAGEAVKIDADMLYPLDMGPGVEFVGVLADSGTANCRVYAEIAKRVR